MTNEEKDVFITLSVDNASKIMIEFTESLDGHSFAIQDSNTGKKYLFTEIDKDTDLTKRMLS